MSNPWPKCLGYCPLERHAAELPTSCAITPVNARRHLPKCFDNLHNLEFRKDAEGQPTKAAIGMYSGEGEYVAFAKDCICDGPVENWLQVRSQSFRSYIQYSQQVDLMVLLMVPLTNNQHGSGFGL